MRKYDTPDIKLVVLHSTDCITSSGTFRAIEEGSGDVWDWSLPVNNGSGLV